MILAAGEGTRLKPLTERLPKPLIEIGGVPIIEIVLNRLLKAGVDGVAINTWHLADKVESFLNKAQSRLGVKIHVSREEVLLDTGGGIKKAAAFLNDGRPFFVHNADVLSEIDLGALYRCHERSGALATLAVSDRPGPRRLLFDASGRLVGREAAGEAPEPGVRALAFNGIHVLSPGIFNMLGETGAFSIIASYLRLAEKGENLLAYDVGSARWLDIGTPESLDRARKDWGKAAL